MSRLKVFNQQIDEKIHGVSSRLITASYVVTIGYCTSDICWEAYKLHRRGYVTENNQPMTLLQCVIQRSIFQYFASYYVPTLAVRSSMEASHLAFDRVGRFRKWGPSFVGLMVLLTIPKYCDASVEFGVKYAFDHVGPWRIQSKAHED